MYLIGFYSVSGLPKALKEMNLMCTVLRSINPSYYLFFFDYGDFKIFGSSQAQIIVKDRRLKFNP
jgi:anthranilate/para-aminobenzoate synthase component I